MAIRDRIVIGASAGGIGALRELVSRLPADLRAAVFIALHMTDRMGSHVADILNSAGPLRAELAQDGRSISNGQIYIAAPDHHLLIGEERIRLSRGPKEGLQRPSINVMFRSAASNLKERVAGVILTGLLDDGAAGLWDILQNGGVTIVQDPEEAAYRSMPENAIRGLNVQYILRIHEMAPLLTRLSMGEKSTTTSHHHASAEFPIPRATATLQACPECGGVMIAEQHGSIKEYVCHVGHRLGLQSMISEKESIIERAMWTVVAHSEELVTLLEEAKVELVPAEQDLIQVMINRYARVMEYLHNVVEKVDTQFVSGHD